MLQARTFVIATLVLAAMTCIWPLTLWGDAYNFRENGPVEGPQSVFLAFAAALFLWTALRPPPGLNRLEVCGIALFCFNFFIRETDVRGTWADPYLGGLFAYGRVFFLLTGLWVNVVALTILRFKATALDLLRWMRSRAGIAMVVGCLFYVSGDRAEKHWFFNDHDRGESLEETLELYGCFFILLSAGITARRSALLRRNEPA